MASRFLKRLLLGGAMALWGRSGTVRLGKFLLNGARLDAANDPETNGEHMVQSVLVDSAPAGRPLCVLDVGANVGEWTQSLAERASQRRVGLRVHAFEPCAATADTLARNLAQWGISSAVQVNRLALSDKAAVQSLYVTGPNRGTNSLYPVPGEEEAERLEVVSVTLDGYCEGNAIGQVDFIKVDTEGHDFEVIRGAARMLERKAVGLMQFEYNYRWIFARRFLRDAFEFLLPLGYEIGKVTSQGIEWYKAWHPELETFVECNCLAALPDWKARFPAVAWWHEQ